MGRGMTQSAADRSGEGSRAVQHVRSAGDAYSAARDITVYQGGVTGPPEPRTGPGLFSVLPPYGRLPSEVRGRSELIDRLWAELSSPRPRICVLHGLGGCGKSTVALSVARRARAEGRDAWWVSAADPATLHSGLRQLAVDIGVDPDLVKAAWEGELSAPDLVWRGLDAHPRPWLLVVDEADDPGSLSAPGGLPTDGNGWLRQGRNGAVMVTTRDGNLDLWRHALLHPLRELPPEQAVTVLLDQLPAHDAAGPDADGSDADGHLTDAARQLADALGGLPLALQLAGSYVGVQCRRHLRRAGGADVAAYAATALRDYETQVRANVALLDEAAGRTADRRSSDASGRVRVTATWERSLRLLEDRGMPEARVLLQVLAGYESTPVPLRVLDPAALSRSALFPEGMDARRRDDVLDALFDFAVVEETLLHSERGGVPCVKVHRLVGETVAARTDRDGVRADVWALAANLLADAASGAEDHEGEALWWAVAAPHFLRLLPRCPEPGEALALLLGHARTAADTLRDLGSFGGSLAMAETSYRVAARVLGPGDRDTLRCRYTYANALSFDSRGREATAEVRAAWEAQESLLGGEHLETLTSRSFYAERIGLEGHYPEARGHLEEAVGICVRVLGPDHPLTLRTQSQYGVVLRKLGRYRESVQLHRHVLERREATMGSTHIEVTRSRNNLAFTLCHLGMYREGEAEHRVNLDARRRLLGPDHALTLVTMSNLAVVLRDMGQFEESEALCEQVIDVRTRTRGADHTATLIARTSLVILRVLQGRAAEVLQEAEDVLAARRRQLGPAHPSTLLSVKTLGSVLMAIGRTEEAEEHLVGLHALRRERLGEEHPFTLSSALEVARLRDVQGRHREGLVLALGAAEIWERGDRTHHVTAIELRFLEAAFGYALGELDGPAYVAALEVLGERLEAAGLGATPLAGAVGRELSRPGSRHDV